MTKSQLEKIVDIPYQGPNPYNISDDRVFVVRQCEPEPNGCKAQKTLERCKEKFLEVE
ncbi:MAG: hypothetical protein PWQ06_129 [Anaerophaga sp.]|nr:hypothetical protein [Anaerophaga sp.]